MKIGFALWKKSLLGTCKRTESEDDLNAKFQSPEKFGLPNWKSKLLPNEGLSSWSGQTSKPIRSYLIGPIIASLQINPRAVESTDQKLSKDDQSQ